MPDTPWPRPLSAADVEHWLEVLAKYTEGGASSKAKPPKDMYVKLFRESRHTNTYIY